MQIKLHKAGDCQHKNARTEALNNQTGDVALDSCFSPHVKRIAFIAAKDLPGSDISPVVRPHGRIPAGLIKTMFFHNRFKKNSV